MTHRAAPAAVALPPLHGGYVDFEAADTAVQLVLCGGAPPAGHRARVQRRAAHLRQHLRAVGHDAKAAQCLRGLLESVRAERRRHALPNCWAARSQLQGRGGYGGAEGHESVMRHIGRRRGRRCSRWRKRWRKRRRKRRRCRPICRRRGAPSTENPISKIGCSSTHDAQPAIQISTESSVLY